MKSNLPHTLLLSAGVLLMLGFGGCAKSTAPAQANVPAPPSPPPPSSSGSTMAVLPQMLPDADATIPIWAGQQQSEPFAVRQFLESRASPPSNAAPLYFAGLAEISLSMYLSNPPATWPWSENKIPDRVRKLDNDVNVLADYDMLLQGAVSEAAIESLLSEAQPALKKFDEAQQRRQCVFVTGIRFDSVLPHAQASRQFVRLACIQLYHARLKGDFDEADQAIRRTLRLSRDVRLRGAMVVQLVSCVLDRVILRGVADYTLGQRGLAAKDCDRLLAVLSEHRRKAAPFAEEGFRMEYVTLRNTLDLLQQGRMSPEQLALLPGEIVQSINQVNWQAEIAACNTFFNDAIAFSAAGHEQEQSGAWMAREAARIESQHAPLVRAVLPACDGFLEGTIRARTELAGAECLTAVRRYVLLHGSLPDNLDVAAREAGLVAVPTDSYSGGPMHYRVIDGKPIVYSVGYDRKDDGGTVDWDNGKQPGDFIFRIRE
jgi:hypothetical protein